uniref:Uncharacterized protein n=1 Tax=viral metagenome TaxID=1070528 RepID=A0A6C0ET00_9ZZZZ
MTYYDYIHNNLQNNAFIPTDNNIIFEFKPAIVANNYIIQPNYEPNDNLGFSDVSAIATIDVLPSILNKLFYFQTNGNIDTVLKYGINTHFTFGLEYSKSNVVYGYINPDQLKNDYINYLSYAITNLTINPSTLFSNYNTLISGVQNMDPSFNQTFNSNFNSQNSQTGVISFNNLNILLLNNTLNPYALSTKQLVDGMKHLASEQRKNLFLNDIANQTNNQNIYWVPFHSGDKLSIVIQYVPPNGNGNPVIGTNPIYTRSYKIVLNCLSLILPDNIAHIAYNSKGNLDPMYCLRLLDVSLNTFVETFNLIKSNSNTNSINIYKQIGPIVNLMDYYFKTFMSLVSQPSTINNGLINNGMNPSFQYIFLNSTITTILYPSLRTIKESLLTSPCNYYPTLNNLQDITCELNSDNSSNFFIRIYTRPIFNGIDNSFNSSDSFFGNYYDSISLSGTTSYTYYNLSTLFPYWTTLLTGSYVVNAYYNNNGFGYKQINTFGEQQILSICIFTTVLNSNIGIKNIELIYK